MDSDSVPSLQPERWLEEHGDYLFNYAVSRVRDAATAEDMVQETFLAALKTGERFSGRSSERTWLTGILKHKILDYFRKASREQTYGEPQEAENLEIDAFFDRWGRWKASPPDWQVKPDRAYENQEFAGVLESCLNALRPRLKAAFTLREVEGLTTEEICKALDITPTNLWVMITRARMALRDCLTKNWFGA